MGNYPEREHRDVTIGKTYKLKYETNIKDFESWKSSQIIYDGAIFPKEHDNHLIKVTKYTPPCCGVDHNGRISGKCICGELLENISTQFLIDFDKNYDFNFEKLRESWKKEHLLLL